MHNVSTLHTSHWIFTNQDSTVRTHFYYAQSTKVVVEIKARDSHNSNQARCSAMPTLPRLEKRHKFKLKHVVP